MVGSREGRKEGLKEGRKHVHKYGRVKGGEAVKEGSSVVLPAGTRRWRRTGAGSRGTGPAGGLPGAQLWCVGSQPGPASVPTTAASVSQRRQQL